MSNQAVVNSESFLLKFDRANDLFLQLRKGEGPADKIIYFPVSGTITVQKGNINAHGKVLVTVTQDSNRNEESNQKFQEILEKIKSFE